MTTRSNPFKELERLFERMGKQFEESARMWEAEGSVGFSFPEFEALAIDLVEHDDEFVVTVDVPGFTRDEVDVEVTEHTLRIEAEHEETTDEEKEEYLRHERREDSMQRSVRLPDTVETEGVTARMKNGVLTVTLPKLEVENVHSIDIEEE